MVEKHKVVIVGDTNVGKSCIFVRCQKGKFDEHTTATVSANYAVKPINLPNGENIFLQLWDTAGSE